MDIKIKELVKCSEKVKICDEEYLVAKNNLEMLKASYVLKNDWEKVLDKPKPTQKEKDAFMQVELEEKINAVNKLKVEADYQKRVFEIHMLANKEYYL